jgi:uridylate kinase
MIDKNATMYKRVTYREVLNKELRVMDLAAFCQCRDQNISLRVFNITVPGNIKKVILSEEVGTLVERGEE